MSNKTKNYLAAKHRDYRECETCLSIVYGIKDGYVKGEELERYLNNQGIRKKKMLYHEKYLIQNGIIHKRRRLLEAKRKLYSFTN